MTDAATFSLTHRYCVHCGKWPAFDQAGRLESHTYPPWDAQQRTGECRGTGLKVTDGTQLELEAGR